MAATIKIKNSSTASAVPTSSDLVQGELAVNVTDKRLFTENASGTVVELGTNPTILTMGAAGSASAPVITRTGDTNTGIFFPAADTIAFAEGGTETMRLDSSGNMGLGTTSPARRLDVRGGTGIQVNEDGSGTKVITIRSDFAGVDPAINVTTNNALLLMTNNTERARIDSSGNLLVGQTTAADLSKGFSAVPGTGSCYATIGHASGTASGYSYLIFGYNSSNIGSITQNGTTGVLYNLTSDYRLKNNPEALTGAKDFVMALQPKKWQWWDGSGEGVGFIAHEFMEVAKYSGQGEKDAVDANGNPVYQSIQPSSSEVMAYLVAHIQNLETRLAALENQ
jgi:hypothetical protein